MAAPCNRDCFHCVLHDCVVDKMDAADRESERFVDSLLFPPHEKKKRENERRKERYIKNHDAIIERTRRYREKNREKINAYMRERYRKAKGKITP